MTYEQMTWASKHDWFNCASLRPDGTWRICVRPDDGGDIDEVFTDFTELYHWAGY